MGLQAGKRRHRGLEVRNGFFGNTFTDYQGVARTYTYNAASIFVERGEGVTLRNCNITGSGNGFFVASGSSEELQSRNITAERCHFWGNGNVDRDREHNVYTEAIGIVFQFNRFGPLRAGAAGANLKDRSAGTVVRYNWIEDGAHLMDLVDPQESAAIACADPSYQKTLVYGNILFVGPNGPTNPIHYGGDSGIPADYRNGVLHFYDNTIVVQRDQSVTWRVMLFKFDTNDQTADLRNNIIFSSSATAGATPTEVSLLEVCGTINLGINWISPGWLAGRTGFTFLGAINGASNLIASAGNSPGFANLAARDFHLAAGSSCIGAAGLLSPAVLPDYDVLCEYIADQAYISRSSTLDLGGYGSTSIVPAPTVAPGSLTAASAPGQVKLSWTDTTTTESGFRIERSPDGLSFTQIGTVGANVTTYTDATVADTTPYTYRVCAYTNGGNSPYTNTAAVTSAVSLPKAPSSLAASALSSSQIALSWVDNSTNETSFAILRSSDGVTFVPLVSVSANVKSYTDPNLNPLTKWYYRVQAVNSAGGSAHSTIASATTAGISPAAPNGLTATPSGNNKIVLSWADNSANETNFLVERSLDGVAFTQVDTVGVNVKSYSDGPLAQRTKYYYRVRSKNANGSSAPSNVASATTGKP